MLRRSGGESCNCAVCRQTCRKDNILYVSDLNSGKSDQPDKKIGSWGTKVDALIDGILALQV